MSGPYEVMSKMFQEKKFSDFVVSSNGHSFPCHKAVLGHGSEVMMKMIESRMVEGESNKLELNTYPADAVEKFVEFFYTGEVEEEIVAEHYQV